MKSVIVTGANGFIGSSLIKKLIENNISVLAIDLYFNNSNLPKSDLITCLSAELDDNLFNKIPSGKYDTFFHFAWQGVNGADKVDPIVQINNIKMAVTCAKVAKLLECEKFLSAGTIAEQSVQSLPNIQITNGGMMYGAAKHSAHLILETLSKNIGLNMIWMQFSNIYGENNKTGNLISYTLNQIGNGDEATFGPANQPYDFVYIGDVIEAVYRLGTNKTNENIYFIGSGKPRILKYYLLEIGEIFGRPNLVKIGVHSDDGIKYSFDMFNISKLENDIGKYVSESFGERIQSIISNYKSV